MLPAGNFGHIPLMSTVDTKNKDSVRPSSRGLFSISWWVHEHCTLVWRGNLEDSLVEASICQQNSFLNINQKVMNPKDMVDHHLSCFLG